MATCDTGGGGAEGRSRAPSNKSERAAALVQSSEGEACRSGSDASNQAATNALIIKVIICNYML